MSGDLSHLCGASAPGLILDGHQTFVGPCVLRVEHPGPVHVASDGSAWTDPAPEPEPLADWERELLDEKSLKDRAEHAEAAVQRARALLEPSPTGSVFAIPRGGYGEERFQAVLPADDLRAALDHPEDP